MWLLKYEVAESMQRAVKLGMTPTSAQCAEFVARQQQAEALNNGRPPNFKVAGDVAEISVDGVLTRKPDFFAWLFGGGNTSYESIVQSIALAETDPAVRQVVFNIHSPGGHVEGLFDTLAAIEGMKKKRSVRASMADSAAYAIAAAAGRIEAVNPASEFGSIGVAMSFLQLDEMIDITSTNAPNKRPDVSTPEGQAVVREYLDAIHELFADAIARGRGTTVKDVNENFGRGSVLLANDAKRRGMIDKVSRPALRAVAANSNDGAGDEAAKEVATAAVGGAEDIQSTEPKKMDLKTLQAQHPELFETVVQKGVTQERDRVSAHLQMGEASGDMKTAVEAIRSGEGMTQTMTAKYLSAGMNRAAVNARQADSDQAGAALNGAGAPPSEGGSSTANASDPGDAVASVVERLTGTGKSKMKEAVGG